jgi:transposase
MLSKEEFIVLRHYLKEGVPKAAIARKLGISRMTVYRQSSNSKTAPGYKPRPVKPKIIDPFQDYIRERLELYPELTATRILTEIQSLGYQGKYTAVKDFVHLVRPKVPIEIEQRFESLPGEQAQVDFATFKTGFGTVYAMLVVLSWSRYLWVRFFFHQDELTVLGGLHRAFIFFGGVPKTLLFDRMKTAVASSAEDGRAIFNEEMLRFASYYGFKPTACRPYRAKTKGKVERAVSYLRKSFFYGRNFRDFEDLNSQLDIWLKDTANARVHGTTGEVPAVRLERERSHLLPIPSGGYTSLISLGRRVSHDGYVSYNGNDYSVPEGLVKPEVTVSASLEEVRLYQDGSLIAVHPVLEGKGNHRLDPDHRRSKKETGKIYLLRESPALSELLEVQRRPLEVYEEVLR